jgi:hypothetical protein
MLVAELEQSALDVLNQPFVELSFGVIGRTLPADLGDGLYSAIALSALYDTLFSSTMPLGVEHRTATLCIVALTFDAVRRFPKLC